MTAQTNLPLREARRIDAFGKPRYPCHGRIIGQGARVENGPRDPMGPCLAGRYGLAQGGDEPLLDPPETPVAHHHHPVAGAGQLGDLHHDLGDIPGHAAAGA